MKLGAFVEDFLYRFIHLYYEFPEGVVDSDFIKEKFQSLILLTLRYFESKLPNDSPPPTYANHETHQSFEEEPTIPFVPCPPPFLIPIWVSPCDDVEVGKSVNQIFDPYSPPSLLPMI